MLIGTRHASGTRALLVLGPAVLAVGTAAYSAGPSSPRRKGASAPSREWPSRAQRRVSRESTPAERALQVYSAIAYGISKHILYSKLNQPRIDRRAGNLTEAPQSNIRGGIVELRVVEQVQELGTELQRRGLMNAAHARH